MSRNTLTILTLLVTALLAIPLAAAPHCTLGPETRLNASPERVTGVTGVQAGDQLAVSWTSYDGVHYARLNERLEILTPDVMLFPSSADARPGHPTLALTDTGFEVGWSARVDDTRYPYMQSIAGDGRASSSAQPLHSPGDGVGTAAQSVHASLLADGDGTWNLEVARFQDGMRVSLQRRSASGALQGDGIALSRAQTVLWPRLARVGDRIVAAWLEGDDAGDIRLAVIENRQMTKVMSLTQGGSGGAFALLADRGRLIVAYDSWQGAHFDQYLARVNLDSGRIDRTPLANSAAHEFDPLLAQVGNSFVVVSGEHFEGRLWMVVRSVADGDSVQELARKELTGGLSYRAGALAMDGASGVLVWSDDRDLVAQRAANVLAARLECSGLTGAK